MEMALSDGIVLIDAAAATAPRMPGVAYAPALFFTFANRSLF